MSNILSSAELSRSQGDYSPVFAQPRNEHRDIYRQRDCGVVRCAHECALPAQIRR